MSSAFRAFLNSPTGPRTVHFWAPMMKWGLVMAGAGEMVRPVEKVSATQQLSLFATGVIWTRWACIIKPKNYLLASVNFFLGGVASAQIIRIYSWRRSLGETPNQIFKYMFDLKDKPKVKQPAAEVAAEAETHPKV
ncbi:Mitochondrial pyruvate carrier subunit [Brettanomyces nanus]|uniref:Mitochondrial pyruvate carrier n=1 Tax=Eeniella nana TaxID=13502 RepID=A0A875RTY6_EENNA|nr:Mitochondrial pyruvate carrier subunit [Brettanomyces nanus]QPG74007.1 Mitochondrial pyruvate carrier subunit [Brettanomyces nanus]